MTGCDNCDGRIDAPGGIIWSSTLWVVDHCVGPLGVGTLILKPIRHCTSVADLTEVEALELGPALQKTAMVVSALSRPSQVYTTLWSHAGWRPGHIHWVIQPVPADARETYSSPGPMLQSEMFVANIPVNRTQAEQFAEQAREMFRSL